MQQPVIIVGTAASLAVVAVVAPTGPSTPATFPAVTNFPPVLTLSPKSQDSQSPGVYVVRPYTIMIMMPGSTDSGMSRHPEVEPHMDIVTPDMHLEPVR